MNADVSVWCGVTPEAIRDAGNVAPAARAIDPGECSGSFGLAASSPRRAENYINAKVAKVAKKLLVGSFLRRHGCINWRRAEKSINAEDTEELLEDAEEKRKAED